MNTVEVKKEQLPLIWNEANAVKELFEKGLDLFIMPAMPCVCGFMGCFACELYLKCLAGYHNIQSETGITHFIKDHKLQELFSDLPEQVKSEIKIKTGTIFGTGFDDCLSACSEGFKQFRYYFEDMKPQSSAIDWSDESKAIHINEAFLHSFCNALKELSTRCVESNECEIKPEDYNYYPIILDLDPSFFHGLFDKVED